MMGYESAVAGIERIILDGSGDPKACARAILAFLHEPLARPGASLSRDIPRATRRYVLQRDAMVCGICKLGISGEVPHLDHVVPYSHGGTHSVDNLRSTHSRCNMARGNRNK